jgi:hypothetical protein
VKNSGYSAYAIPRGCRPANDEMVEGYCDGLDLDAPEPSANRSASYRHGFLNGRDDRRGQPRDTFANLNLQAELAMDEDDARRAEKESNE